MVQLKVKLGPKGQVVIPKIARDMFKLIPGNEIIIEITDSEVIIKSNKEDIVEKLESIAKKVNKGKKIKTLTAKELKKIYDEQYEERARKAGIKFKK